MGHYGLTDSACLGTGVTTAVDAGTVGRCTWPVRRYQLDPARMNLYAFLNISGSGS